MSKGRLIVVGGGAAGFFCAVNAARLHPGLQVSIFEKSNHLLSKVKISGGGRCNVTHACSSIVDMSRNYPRGGQFLKKAFHHFFVQDTIEWFASRFVSLKTESDGRMFPVTDDSSTVVDCLLKEAEDHGVEIFMGRAVTGIEKRGGRWLVQTGAETHETDWICIAAGGFPKISQFDWISSTGHQISPPIPSLFTFNMPSSPLMKLMGVSITDVKVKISGMDFEQRGPLLITHWGLSGPCVLKLSAWAARELHDCNYHFSVLVNWLPDYHQASIKEELLAHRSLHGKQKIFGKNPFGLPVRLWDQLLCEIGIPEDQRWSELTAKDQNLLSRNLCQSVYEIKGKTTFKEEFVTAGGVRLDEVDVNRMESKLHPGLFFAGEILDLDGVTGGFNFQAAWTTAYIAAKSIS
jgi:predicted Rossmann fold flavoprotein